MSSANSINLSKLDERWMSLILKSNGPMIEPCGTPHLTFNLMIRRGHAVTFNILFAICEVTTDSFWCFFPVAREMFETFTATKNSYHIAETFNLTKN